jgi:hypothetical protein
MVRRLFFLGGIAAVLLYVAAVITGGALRPGYNHISMAISELIAVGAPHKALLDGLFIAYNVLLIVFAWALGMSVRGGSGLAVAGATILAFVGAIGLVMTLLFPMDARGSAVTTTGTVHLVLAGALSLGCILAILFLALGSKDRDAFWVYAMISCFLVIITGAWAAYTASQGSALMGLAERLTIGLFLQWIVGIAARLVKEDIGR